MVQEPQTLSSLLEDAKKCCQHLHKNPISTQSISIKSLLDLENAINLEHRTNPVLFNLSQHLSNIKTLIQEIQQYQGYSIRLIIHRKLNTLEVSRLAGLIENEIQLLIDREWVQRIGKILLEEEESEEVIAILIEFEGRVSQGFNGDLQDLILRGKLFSILESMLCDESREKRIRERVGITIVGLVRFNKDVFVGLVLMGPTIRALISLASNCSISVLSALISLIKSPLVDEIESNGQIPIIMSLLGSEDRLIRVSVLECILEIGYFGRREAVEAMLESGLIEKLMELQRLEAKMEEDFDDNSAFSSCVVRFSVQLEVGEGLRQREKREFKLEILTRVKQNSVSEAEAASISAQVLWGSSP